MNKESYVTPEIDIEIKDIITTSGVYGEISGGLDDDSSLDFE